MSEPSVEEIVADLERQACYTWPVLPPEQILALIADWRKRGEALANIRDADPVEMALDPEWPSRIARAALKGSP